MLNQARQSFYLYEPCRAMEGDVGVKRFSGKPNVKRCTELLRRLLDCQFDQEVRSTNKTCISSTMTILVPIALLCREYHEYCLSKSHGTLRCF